MKIRAPFSFRIILPFVVLAALFLVIFICEPETAHRVVIWLSAAGVLAAIATGLFQVLWLRKSLRRIRSLLDQLTKGAVPAFRPTGIAGEIGDLESVLEQHVSKLREISSFARSMAAGDFEREFDKARHGDEIGEALLSLKESLMDSRKESEMQRREEENRTWAAHGLAKFSSLFRESEDDLEELSRLLMKELVGYTEADAGALFIVNGGKGESGRDGKEQNGADRKGKGDAGRTLVLRGSYAFDRTKYGNRIFLFGEGLVGRAAVEKESIYITDLPTDYMKIRSGLGEDLPASVLLVPVLLDNNVLGVIELAALGEIPGYQRTFIRQLGDALAATLSKVQANLQARQLFEQTRAQAEALASQEKVFKTKLEELESAYRESLKREEQLQEQVRQLRKAD